MSENLTVATVRARTTAVPPGALAFPLAGVGKEFAWFENKTDCVSVPLTSLCAALRRWSVMAQRKKGANPERPVRSCSRAIAPGTAGAEMSPHARLQSCMEKFDATEQKAIRAARTGMRKRLPAANELLYDYGSFFVLAYSMTEHPKDAIASIAARTDGVRLYLLHSPRLPDPQKLLRGSGKQVRYVALDKSTMLASPGVEALLAAAIAFAGIEMPKSKRGELIDRTPGQKNRASRGRAPRSR